MTQKTITVNLDLNARGNAAAQLRSTAQAATQLGKAGQAGPGVGGGPNVGAGMAGPGMAGQNSALQQLVMMMRQNTMAQAAAAKKTSLLGSIGAGTGMRGMLGAGMSFAGVQMLAQGASRAIGTATDPSATGAEKMRRTSEGLPVVGGLIKSLRELDHAIKGITKDLKIRQLAQESDAAKILARGSMASQQLDIARHRTTLGSMSKAHRGIGQVRAPGSADFDTFQGRLKYSRGVEMLPAEIQLRQAKIGEMSSRIQETEEEKRVVELRRQHTLAEKRTNQAGGRFRDARAAEGGNFGLHLLNRSLATSGIKVPGIDAMKENPLRKTDALNEFQNAFSEQKQIYDQLLEAEKKLGEARKQSATSSHQVAQAEIRIKETRQRFLQQDIGRASGAAQSFGGMMAPQRAALAQASSRFQKHGIGGVTPGQLGLLRQFAPDVIGTAQETAGAKDPMFHQIGKDLGMRTDLEGMRKADIKLTQELTVKVQANEEALATAVETKFNKTLDKLSDLIEEKLRHAIRGVEIGQSVRNASAG